MNQNSRGFTVAELLITLSIAGILVVIGVPNFTTMIRNNRMSTQINEMVAEVSFARSEAVKRGMPVTVCKRNTAGNACNNAGTWLDGWIVFSDINSNGVVDAGADEVLRVHGALAGLTGINYSRNNIRFNANGSAVGGGTDTISFCDSRGINYAKGLAMSNTGRLRKAVTTAPVNDVLTCP